MIGIPCFKIDENDNFIEVVTFDANKKAEELQMKFGGLAIDVVDEILDVIKYEDNSMFYTITFYNEVKNILTNNLFNDYIEDCKKQLIINATEDYKSQYITYSFTNEQIDDLEKQKSNDTHV